MRFGEDLRDAIQGLLNPVMLLLFGLTAPLIADHLIFSNDSWWHLVNGRVIIEQRIIPATEIFSHTAAGTSLSDHSWGSDLIFGALEKLGGLELVELFGLLLAACIARIVFALALELGGSGLAAALGTLLSFICSYRYFIIRPHLFTMLCAAIVMWWYLRLRNKGEKWIYLFPLLALFWSNLHGGFILGLFLLGALALTEYIEGLLSNDGASHLARAKILTLLAVIGAVTALIHPLGFEQYISALSNTPLLDPIHLRIDEWLQPKWHEVPLLEASVILTILTAICMRGVPPLYQLALLIGTLHLALTAWRHVILFSILGVPIMIAWVSDVIAQSSLLKRISSLSFRRTLHRMNLLLERDSGVTGVASFLILALLLLAVQRYSPPVLESAGVRSRFPVAAAEWIKANPSEGEIFNTYGWGGYLMYALWPEKKVFIDSRMIPYKDRIFDEHFDVLLMQDDWQGILSKYRVKRLVLPQNEILGRVLKTSPQWQHSYVDGVATVLDY